VPVAALAAVILIAAGLYGAGYRLLYSLFAYYLGADTPFASSIPFLDAHGVLSAIECHRIGLDVYATNPCDLLGRTHQYSPLWLHLPGDVSWTPAFGFGLIALFLVSLLMLPPARGAWQGAAIVLGTVSATVVYAIERANVDLLMFFSVVLMVWLAQRRNWLRFVGYILVLAMAALKFYPAAALAIIARERIATALVVGLVGVACLAGVLAIEWHDFTRAAGSLVTGCNPSFFGSDAFGAQRLPCGIARMVGWPDGAATLILILLSTGVIAAAAFSSGALSDRIASLTELERTSMLAGCAVLVFCFFCVDNILYRGIFLLLVLPGLTAMVRRPGNGGADVTLLIAVLLMLLLLGWQAAIHVTVHFFSAPFLKRINYALWAVHELMWWVAITVLGALLLSLLLQTEAWADLCALTKLRSRTARFGVGSGSMLSSRTGEPGSGRPKGIGGL
jgi:hypothetical protein